MLIILVIVLGKYFGWSSQVQLIAIIGILLIGIVMLVIGYVRANKSASAIQNSIHSQAEQQRQGVRPDNQAEIEQLQRDLEDAIERLKHSKLGGGRSGKAALYALPWYMIIGPPAAGKTTAITNSGLNFPIGMEAFRGVGGTRNCDWFFSDSAIFLDTAGRYMTEQDDTEEWNIFLQTLRENRRKQPINGVMVAISINELADATPDQIEWHASTIRRRIDDLVTRLDVTFPIYLIFTKLDLLRGFTQFFGALSRKEREQILGCTLPQKWEEESNLRELFEYEFDQIASALLNWRNESLGLAMKRAERHLVYVFPLEFASLKEKLTQFITMLFQPNPYRDTPSFRGFYFSSGTQEGVPIDRVLSAIAGRFGLEPAAFEESEPVTETKAYFIKDIFEKVIIPDRYLVTQTSRAAVRGRFMKTGIAAVTLILLVLFVIGATQAVVRSSTRLGEVRQASIVASQIELGRVDLTDNDKDTFESLQSLIARLERRASFGWGLDKGTDVRDSARRVLLKKVRTLVSEYVFPRLSDRIARTSRLDFVDARRKDSLRENTKAYLLLTSHTAVLDSVEGNAEFLKDRLRSIASELSFLNDERVGSLIDDYVDGLGDCVSEDGVRECIVDGFTADDNLVSRASDRLTDEIDEKSLYEELKRDGERHLGFLSLENLLPAKATYFDTRSTISKFFTLAGWRSFVEEKIDEYSEAPVRDAWVPWAMETPQVAPDEFKKGLTDLYLNDYRDAWEDFLRDVRVKTFRDVKGAATSVEMLADPVESPILFLLAKISSETTFPRSGRSRIADGIEGSDRESQNVVEESFQFLHNLIDTETGETDASLENARSTLSDLGRAMGDLIDNPTAQASFAERVLSSSGDQLSDYLGKIENAFGQSSAIQGILVNLFERPIFLAWETVLRSVQTNLNSRWDIEVYRLYRSRLEGKYPLGDGNDVRIRDFEDFFGPSGGTVSQFVDAVLSPFLEDNGEPRKWRTYGINLSANTSSGGWIATKNGYFLPD